MSLKSTEELFGLRHGQTKMLDTLAVFVERDHIGDGLFLTLIAAQDELKFDTHTGASPGSSGRCMIQAIVPELLHNPQHLPALVCNRGHPFGGIGSIRTRTEHGFVLRARMLGPQLYDKGRAGAIPKPGKDAIVSKICDKTLSHHPALQFPIQWNVV